LAERRGPASVAQGLYEETAESRAARQRLQEQLRVVQPLFVYEEKGRPTKKDRRMIDRWDEGRS
jgi:ribosome-associated heat shock protein Hsp15